MSVTLHPISKEPIDGRRLEPGEKIQPGDYYASCSGDWVAIGKDGKGKLSKTVSTGTTVVWVRQEKSKAKPRKH